MIMRGIALLHCFYGREDISGFREHCKGIKSSFVFAGTESRLRRLGRHWPRAAALALFGMLLFGLPTSSPAQWRTQTFNLQAGWNAIYLGVRPSPMSCDALFTNLPVEGVYRHNAHQALAQFDTDPDDLFMRPTEWLSWVPHDGASGYVRTLENMIGDATYLIKATTNCAWTVRGQPVLPRIDWIAGKANMAGFQVSASADQQPTFADFFRYEPGIDATPDPGDERIYEIGPDLQHTNITGRTGRQKILPGRAYWVVAQGLSDFVGGLDVDAGGANGLAYGAQFNELILQIKNVYGTNVTVAVRHLPSDSPPEGTPDLAGEAPLLWADRDNGGYNWVAWPTTGPVRTKQLAAGKTWEIRLAINRALMSERANALWQSVLQVSSSMGSLHYVPVSAEFAQTNNQLAPYPFGLWVGEASITHVSYIGFDTNSAGESPTEPLQVSSPFPLRLILHTGSDGNVRLLQRALVATVREGDSSYVNRIYTDEARVPAGASVATRISSPAFGRISPVVLSGDGFLRGVSGSFAVDYDDPMNPFKHSYHPDHDNKKPVTNEKLPEGEESFSITNQVWLTWNTNAPSGNTSAFWNPDETTTGTYEHTIQNLRHTPITLRGAFTLRRVSRVELAQ